MSGFSDGYAKKPQFLSFHCLSSFKFAYSAQQYPSVRFGCRMQLRVFMRSESFQAHIVYTAKAKFHELSKL